MAAQNQHYVPKFILRQFVIGGRKEQVRVYDKLSDREFSTSIANIMAERRFNEFQYEDYIASFEEIATRIEDSVLPAYRSVLTNGNLENTPDQQAALAFLIAFQFVRTKAHRDKWKQLEQSLREKIEQMGGTIEDLEEYEPPSDNNVKKQHLLSTRDYVASFAPLIAAKCFVLMKAPKGKSFYLGDNPVVLHNAEEFGPYGNIGLAVRGIEIYMPLSSEYVLCALCPTVIQKMRNEFGRGRKERQAEMVAAIAAGKITIAQSIRVREMVRPFDDEAETIIKQFETGGTVNGTTENVDFINSLQAMYASRFLVCKRANLALAKRHNQEFPKYRTGVMMSFS